MINKINNTDNTTDDFLKDLEGTEFIQGKTEISEPAKDKPIVDAPISNKSDKEDEYPELAGTEYPEEYIKVVERIRMQYSFLPNLDYDSIYQELAEFTVKSSPTPTLEVLNDELHRVQASKDRLSEIMINVIKCYNFKKRAVDILKDAWGKFTLEKNTEGRKGDAAFRLSFFMIDYSRTESLSKTCDHILKNLDSLQDNLSRRITIWQLLLKLREGRMALPDYDFDKELGSKLDSNSLFGDQKEDKEDAGVSLREF